MFLGSGLAVVGTLSATAIFRKVLDVSGGQLGTTHALQDQIITWEIKALAVMAGGFLAGMATPNGLKQGLFVGVFGSVVLIGLQAPTSDHCPGGGLLHSRQHVLAGHGRRLVRRAALPARRQSPPPRQPRVVRLIGREFSRAVS